MLRLYWRPDLYEHLSKCRTKGLSLASRSDYSERADFGSQALLRDFRPDRVISNNTEVTYDVCISWYLRSLPHVHQTARHSQLQQVLLTDVSTYI